MPGHRRRVIAAGAIGLVFLLLGLTVYPNIDHPLDD